MQSRVIHEFANAPTFLLTADLHLAWGKRKISQDPLRGQCVSPTVTPGTYFVQAYAITCTTSSLNEERLWEVIMT
jgi:hypothetical protein